MELIFKPHKDNLYKKSAVFIKSTSPLVWIAELNNWSVSLESVSCYVIKKQEETFGCLIVFDNGNIISDINNNVYYQCEAHRLFLPMNTKIEPSVAKNEWGKLLGDNIWFFHPETGVLILDNPFSWVNFIENNNPIESEVIKPAKEIKIPQEVYSFSVELQEDEILDQLNNQFKGEIPKNLPFDIKKLLNGNKAEMEKYLKYLETNPNEALALGIPLDINGVSRNDFLGKYKFQKETWFTKFLSYFMKSKSSNSSTAKNSNQNDSNYGGNFPSVFGGSSDFESSLSNRAQEKPKSKFNYKLFLIFPVLLIFRVLFTTFSSNNNNHTTNYENQAELISKLSKSDEKAINEATKYSKPNKFLLNKADSIFDKRYANHTFPTEKASKKAKKKIKDSLISYYEAKVDRETKNLLKKETPKIENNISGVYSRDSKTDKAAMQAAINISIAVYKKVITDSLNYTYGLNTAKPKIIVGDVEQIDSEGNSANQNSAYPDKPSNHFEQNNNDFPMKTEQISLWKLILIIGGVFAVIAVFFSVLGQVKSVKTSLYQEHLSFGTGQNMFVKILYFVILLVLIIYLIKPLIEANSWGIFTFVIIAIVLILIVRLLNNNKSILKADKKS